MVMFRRVVDSKEQFRTHFLCSDREIERGEANKKIVYHIFFLSLSFSLSVMHGVVVDKTVFTKDFF